MERKSDPPRQQEPVSEPPLAIAAPAPAPADAPVPRLRELPSAQRSEIPPHRLSVHVYSDSPAGRFVILNSAKMREGEQAADGLRVHAIRPDGVVLQHAQTRFFVPR
jgi:general secretion pathway protein B